MDRYFALNLEIFPPASQRSRFHCQNQSLTYVSRGTELGATPELGSELRSLKVLRFF